MNLTSFQSKGIFRYTTVGNCAHGACHRYQKSLLTLNHDISVKKEIGHF